MTRSAAPDTRPVGLTIAGSDSGGGAGIQADLKTMGAHGVFPTSVVTAVTAQNTTGVESTHVLPPEAVGAQFDAVASDFDVRAAKTGMLATQAVIETVTDRVSDLQAPLVVDPVMVAASGDPLLDPGAEEAYEDLIAEATLLTPNTDEADVLTGNEPETVDEALSVGEDILEMGAEAALIKGGHMPGDAVRDILVTGDGHQIFEHDRIDTDATHGSGCTVSSAIVAHLANGENLENAVEKSVTFMERAVRYHLDVGEGPGSVHHLSKIRDRAVRTETAETVESIVTAYRQADISRLVPEVGVNVVGATPYAESVAEVAGVDGRLVRTMSGVEATGGVRFGASRHLSRCLLLGREFDPVFRFATNFRFDDDVEAALKAFDGHVLELDRDEAVPDDAGAMDSTEWAAKQAFDDSDAIQAGFGDDETCPIALVDRGAFGMEPMVTIMARAPETLVERTMDLLEALE